MEHHGVVVLVGSAIAVCFLCIVLAADGASTASGGPLGPMPTPTWAPTVCADRPDDGSIETGYGSGATEAWREFCIEIHTAGCSSPTDYVEVADAAFGLTTTGSPPSTTYTLQIRMAGPFAGDPPGPIQTALTVPQGGLPMFPSYAMTPVAMPTRVPIAVGDRAHACIILGPPDLVFIGVDHNTGTPFRPGWTRSDLAPGWDHTTTGDPSYRTFIVNVGMAESQAPIFADGFESGDVTSWSR